MNYKCVCKTAPAKRKFVNLSNKIFDKYTHGGDQQTLRLKDYRLNQPGG